jgi:phosphate transport system permease protein
VAAEKANKAEEKNTSDRQKALVASLIILKFGEASEYEIKALMAAGLILFLLTLAVNAVANVIVKSTGKSGR